MSTFHYNAPLKNVLSGTTRIPRPVLPVRRPNSSNGQQPVAISPSSNRQPARPARHSDIALPDVSVLDAKYKNLRDHFTIYEQGLKGYLNIARMFRSYDMVATHIDGYSLARRNYSYTDIYQREPEEAWFDNVNLLGSSSNESFGYINVDSADNIVETQVKLPGINVVFGFGPNARNNSSTYMNMTYDGLEKRILANINLLFPEFKIPKRIRKVEVEPSSSSKNRINKAIYAWELIDSFDPMTTRVSLIGLENVSKKFNYKPDSLKADSPTKFTLSKEFKEKFCVTVGGKPVPIVKPYIELSIESKPDIVGEVDYIVFSEKYPPNSEFDLNELPDGKSAAISFVIKAKIILQWPMEFALYVTSAGSKSEFIPFMFKQYELWHRSSYSGAVRKPSDIRKERAGQKLPPPTAENTSYDRSTMPDRVSHLGRILDTIEQQKKKNILVKPRTNEDDFTVLGSAENAYAGEILWVPKDANKVTELIEQMKQTYDAENKRIDVSKFTLKNTELFTDWFFEKFSFMRVSGAGFSASDILGMETFDLTGAMPLDSTTILRELRSPLFADVKASGGSGKNLLDTFLTELARFVEGRLKAKPKNDYMSLAFYNNNSKLKPLGDYLSNTARSSKSPIILEMLQFLNNSGLEPRWVNLAGKPFLVADKKITGISVINQTFVNSYSPIDDEEFEKIRDRSGAKLKFAAALAVLELLRIICEDMWNQFNDLDIAFSTKAHWLRFRLALVLKYAPISEKFEKEALEKQNRITNVEKYNTNIDNIKLPNVPGIKNVMPHQAAAWNVLNEKPDAALIGVAPGGGKTLLSLVDALNLIADNRGKKILAVVPNRLVDRKSVV